MLWVAALLSTMLCLPRLFADELRDGSLEQLALAPQPLALIVLGVAYFYEIRRGGLEWD